MSEWSIKDRISVLEQYAPTSRHATRNIMKDRWLSKAEKTGTDGVTVTEHEKTIQLVTEKQTSVMITEFKNKLKRMKSQHEFELSRQKSKHKQQMKDIVAELKKNIMRENQYQVQLAKTMNSTLMLSETVEDLRNEIKRMKREASRIDKGLKKALQCKACDCVCRKLFIELSGDRLCMECAKTKSDSNPSDSYIFDRTLEALAALTVFQDQ